MRAKLLLLCLLALLVTSMQGQIIQGTIKPGASATEFEIWLKPNFSNTTNYLFQLVFPIAFPSSASPQPTGLTVTLDAGFTAAFGTNYTVTVSPVAQNTGGTEKYFDIVLVRGGAGASNPQTWTASTEFKVLKAVFNYSGSPATFQAKLADYQDGGSDGLGNFYTVDGNANYYITSNSIGNFYASPGNSLVGGNASAGYAQLLAPIPPCTAPSTATITNITNSGADISWPPVSGVTGYQYAVTTSSTPPVSGTGTTNTTFLATGLNPATQYYFHIRSDCGSGNFSAWTTTPFTTLCVLPTVNPITGTLNTCVGSTTQLSDVTAGGVWHSDNIDVATVDANGLVTGVATGTATISYAVTNACGTTTVTAIVTVGTSPAVAAITGTATVCTGSTTQLNDATSAGVWSSNNTGVVTVDANGLVTAVSSGTATIGYAVTNTCGTTTVTTTVTVNAAPTLAAITGTTTVCTSATTQLSDITAGGVWSSNNTGVATVNNSGLVTGVSGGSATISYAVTNSCGTTTVTTTVSVNAAPALAAISGNSSVCTTATTQLSDLTAGGVWSSNNTGVATVNSSGLVTGVSGGTATISYAVTNSCGTTTVTKIITVNTAPSVAAITGTTSVNTGGTTQLSNATAGGTWSSNNTGIAAVNSSGLVTGVSAGSAIISYAVTNSCGTTTVTTVVSVGQSLIQGTIKPGAAANEVGIWLKPNFSNSTQYLYQIVLPVAFPSNANPQPTSLSFTLDPAFTAAFGNNYTVTVNPVAHNTANTENYFDVVLIREGAGASNPQIWTAGTEFKVLTIAFNPAASPNSPVKLADYQDAGSDGLGNFYTVDGNANYYITANSIGNFYASPGNSIVGGNATNGYAQTIISIGCVSPVVAGITGTTTVCTGANTQLSDVTTGGTWSSNNTGVATVNSAGLVTGVSTGTATISYAVTNSCGTTTVTTTVTVNTVPSVAAITGTATVCAGSTTQLSDATANGTWSSNNTGVATVDANGLVAGVSAGTATISYAVTNSCGTTTVTTIVTVNAAPIVAAITGTTTVCAGSTTQLSDVTAGGVWSSNNTGVATVNSSGLVTGVSAGTATISYAVTNSCGTTTVTTTITINTVPSVAAITGTTAVCAGSTTQLSDATAGGTWTSNNTGVATVNSSGLVTAVAAGTATISYAVTNTCGTTTVTTTVTVNAAPIVAAITGSSTVCTGATTQLSDVTAGGTWSSNNTAAATVNSSGLVTGVSGGTSTISYAVTNSCGATTVTKIITVNTAPSVAVITGTSSINTGGTTQLSDATAGGVWSSNNTGVATVNSSGLVTGVSAGSATISYAVTNTCGTTTVSTVVSVGQSLVQGTIKPGAAANDIEVWVKPNFSNNTQYLFQLGFPIAFPASANPQPTGLTVTLDPAFVTAFGNNYTVVIGPVAHNTTNTEKYFNIVLIREGNGASVPQTWTAGTEFKVLTASFAPATAPNAQVKLADYQDGGSNGQGNFYTVDGNANYYITSNSIGNFYASPGNSTVGGDASAGYAQTIASIGCTMPVVASITGTGTVCTGSNTQLSDAIAGGVWSSNNTTVATVNSAGLVTGISAATATISYAVTNSCGTTTVTATITVNASVSSSTNVTACDSYTLPWGQIVTTSGDYIHSYQAANGCDSTVTVHLIINRSSSSHTTVTICSNQLPYSWNNNSYPTAGTFTIHLTNAAGCDSAATLELIVNSTLSSEQTVSGCESYTLPWTQQVTVSGDYTHTYTSIGGCDSTVTYHVNIYHNASSSFTAIACDSYILPWNATVTASGDYAHTYQTINGCDSIVTAHITINYSSSSSFAATACDSYILPWNATVTASGDFTHTYQTINGCDSIVTAHITINHSSSSSLTVSACESYTLPWTEQVTVFGDYTHVYTSVGGCDSTVTIHVTINHNTSSSFDATACDSYVLPWGASATTSGDYTHTYQTIHGCDSVVTAHIMINHSSSSTTEVSICANQLPYNWNNTNYPAAGTYILHFTNAAGCDSAATLVLHVNSNPALVTVPVSSACGAASVDLNNGITSNTAGLTVAFFSDAALTNPISNLVSSAGTYYVRVTNSSNCSLSGSIVVSFSSSLVLTTTPINLPCNSASVNLNTGITSSTAGLTVTFYSDAALTHTISAIVSSAGTYYVKVSNGGACSATGSITISIGDTQNPVINCPGNISKTTTSCNKSVTTNNPTYSDNCSVASITWTMSGATSGNSSSTGINFVGTRTFNAGITTVTYTVKDAAGNTSTCQFTVSVTESTRPVIYCPSNIAQSSSNDFCGKTITVPNPSVSDNCGVKTVTWTMSGATSGSSPATGINYVGTQTFNTGITLITYTVKDASGNSATCGFNVKVIDNRAPVVNCPGNITENVVTGCNKSITVPDPTYSDNCGVTNLSWAMLGATFGASPTTGINTVGTRTFNIGVTTIFYLVTDAAGNSSYCYFTVTVKDNINPTINCPAPITMSAASGRCNRSITTPNPVASDNCGISRLTWTMSGATSGSSSSSGINFLGTKTFNTGVTTVGYTAKDFDGNTATCSFTVTVVDDQNPWVSCPSNISVFASGNNCSKSVSTPNPEVGDNCGIAKLTWTMTGATTVSSLATGVNYVGNRSFNAGYTTVTYKATDLSGNTGTCSFTVRVIGSSSCAPSNLVNSKETLIVESKLEVNAYPSPSEHYFNLRIKSISREEVYIRITDVAGRLLEQMKGSPDQIYRFGDKLMIGTYLAEVTQGDRHVVTKMIKQ